MSLAAALPFLRCPVCAAGLGRDGSGPVRCERGHAFDVARQGYLSLLAGAGAAAGDGAEMVAHRVALLGAGHFDPLAAAVAAAATTAGSRAVEIGAGTGFYLAAALDRGGFGVGIALDVSRYALRRAAHAHPRMAAVGADVWAGLPLRDGAADVVLCVFAPRNGPELRRVLRPDGHLVVATPTPRHLAELIAPLGLLTVDERKDERLAERLAGGFELATRTTCEWTMALDHAAVAALAGMGPSAFHDDGSRRGEAIARLPAPVAVTGSVTVATYAPA